MTAGSIDSAPATITDEAIAEMRAHIGQEIDVRPWNREITEDSIWHFASAVGDDNPIWWDRAAAESGPVGRMAAPPMWLYSAVQGAPVPGAEHVGSIEEWLPGTHPVWAGDRWRWFTRPWLGLRISVTAGLRSVQERLSDFGGRSVVQVERFRFTDADTGEAVAECLRTVCRFDRAGGRQAAKYEGLEAARYGPSQLEYLAEHYEAEPAARRGPDGRDWGKIAQGDSLGTLAKGPLTVTNLVGWLLGWGSPLCQTNRMLYSYLREHPGAALVDGRTGIADSLAAAHWDPYFAGQSGFPAPYDYGCQRFAWLAHLVSDWAGDTGFLREFDGRLRRPNLLGDITWISGTVTGKRLDGAAALIDCELTATNQRGELTASAMVSVELPRG
jgi:acyl dehydratase